MSTTTRQLEALVQIRQTMGPRPAGYAYCGMEDFILKRGTEFESSPLTLEEMEVVLAAARGQRFLLKGCFENAQKLVWRDKSRRLTYVEGYATGSVLAVHHSWVVLDGKKVIDPTWLRGDAPKHLNELGVAHGIQYGVLGEFAEPTSYRGVLFPDRPALKRGLKEASGLCLLDDWERSWPLLKAGAYEKYLG